VAVHYVENERMCSRCWNIYLEVIALLAVSNPSYIDIGY